MITLGTIERRKDARFKIKRVGRGPGSGHGGHTSTRGHKGQKARTGGNVHPSFEGGQMPLTRRLPKKGFTPIFRDKISVVNLEKLMDLPKNTMVDPAYLKKEGIVSSDRSKIKILGKGRLKHSVNVKAHFFSESAKKKIEEVGGKIEVIRVGT